jgi:hypothetical protein
LSKAAIKAGEKVTVSGKGFTPGASVSISLGGVNTGAGGNYGSATVDGSGRFTADVTPARYPDGSALRPGTVVLLAHTADFGEKASAQLQIQANPTLTAGRTTLRVGESVTLSGEGFTPGKTVTIGLAGVNMGHGDRYATVTVDAGGRFSVQLSLARYPDGTPLPPGGITLMASTADGERAMVDIQLTATPAISLDRTVIRSGDRVTVTGQGFTPGAAISISMGPLNGGTGGSYGTALVDTNGRFSLPVTLTRYPDGSALTPGTIVLTAHTADFSQRAAAQIQIIGSPAIALDKISIQPGERVTVMGQGFTPGASVSISLGGVNTGASGTYGAALVDANGRFSLPVTLERYPNGLPLQDGPVVLVAHNASWDERASAQLQIVDRAPAAPTDLRITALTKGATSAEPVVAALQWRDNASNETGHRIQATYTRMNGGTDTQVWSVAANATTAQVSFVAGGINPIGKACFTVTAFNAQGSSSPSNEVCAAL